MKKVAIVASLLASVLLLPARAEAQSLSELFQNLKTQASEGAWERALTTLGTLQREAAKPGQEDAQRRLEGPIQFYRGVCEANLDRADEAVEAFAAFLKIQPDATIDAAVYSTKAVAAFEKARKTAPDGALSLTERYEAFRPAPDRHGDAADVYWAEGPVRWILTDEEKKEWSALTDPNARVAFVEQFWAARAAISGPDGRTFREEFERRVAFADEFLAQDGERRGSLTDRGMVFVLLGPPTYASRKALRSGDELSEAGMSRIESQEEKLGLKATGGRNSRVALTVPQYQGPEHRASPTEVDWLETWHYDVERLPRGLAYSSLDVHYVTKRGHGQGVLQHSPQSRNVLRAAARRARPARRG